MEKNLYIDASHPDETRIVLKSNQFIEEYEFEDKNKVNFKNNIYLGTVSRVEPSLQAAFIDFGRIKHGFSSMTFSLIIIKSHLQTKAIKNVEEKIREDLKNTVIEDTGNTSAQEKENKNNNVEENEEAKNSIKGEENKKNIREKLKNTYGLKKYKIQEVIKPGQVILIQVLKEERGQKGAALTTFISLAGKYTVLMPNTAKGGVF